MIAVTGSAMTKRSDVSVKMDADVVAVAKMVASSRGVSLAEYLSEIVRPAAEKDLEKEYSKRTKVPKSPKGGDKT